jgi:beta-aspartyl-peptidase (threonine type)
MEGNRLACGAVAAVSRVANAVTLARRVLEDGRHVLLVADGAEAFARACAGLLTDADRAARIGARGRALVEATMTVDRVAGEIDASVRSILAA